MTIQMSVSVPTQSQNLSSVRMLTCPNQMNFFTKFSQLSFNKTSTNPLRTSIIRMGGGPRTFPGGVSKWQWKRMQQKKAKQLLKARLCREKQIYEMRKRAELRAAVSELEKPWEVVEKAPALFSVRADEQVKVLADRFQRPGGYDLWSDNDGPQLFQHGGDDFPSARFFPKGVVHSIKAYESITSEENSEDFKGFKEFSLPNVKRGKGPRRFSNGSKGRSESEGEGGEIGGLELNLRSDGNAGKRPSSENFELMGRREQGTNTGGRAIPREFNMGRHEEGSSHGSSRTKGSRGSSGYGLSSDDEEKHEVPFLGRGRGKGRGRGRGLGKGGSNNERSYDARKGLSKPSDLSGEIYDMSLKQDGTYEL
ncbi:hypothetical protein MKW94_006974 [Papaver nudicaule]|uniref:Uncharacterized protein n=1 Tax=Papaver nudicaule TaxID=74823 RepID=A0AA41VHA2_PAPNU|nr:hypothetical protein [Papaver nudicaule]